MKNLKEYLSTIDNKTLVTIFPHPDDETIPTGGLLAEAAQAGWKTIASCLTKGGAGKISFKTNQALTNIRLKEFKNAVRTLGVSKYYLFDFEDASLRKSETAVEKKVKELLEEIQPGVIVTYDHSGATGHPDHILTSLVVKKILKKQKSSTKLLWVSLKGLAKARNKKAKTFTYFSTPNHYLSLSVQGRFTKAKAYLMHRSQIPSLKIKILFLLYSLFISETYHLVDVQKEYRYKYVEYEI